MKKFVEFLMIAFISLIMSTFSFGQSLKVSEKLTERRGEVIKDPRTPVYSKMKTRVETILEISFPGAAAKFAKMFPTASDQVWIIDDGTLFVTFLRDGNRVSAVFATSGVMRYAICYLKIPDIPSAIFEKIVSGYGSYSIFNVKEIISAEGSVYQVTVENVYEYITIQVNNDEMEESKRIRKQI